MLTKVEDIREGDLIIVPYSGKFRCLKVLKVPKVINGSFKCSYYRRPYTRTIARSTGDIVYNLFVNEFNIHEEDFNTVRYFRLGATDILTLRSKDTWLLKT